MESWVDTDRFGRVVDASSEGARLFSMTVRGLTGRSLLLFFLERQQLSASLRALRANDESTPLLRLPYRPMERRQQLVFVELTYGGHDRVRWHLSEAVPLTVPPAEIPHRTA